ncbi:hypothetical protein A9X63_18605 [Klebsiella pneumoniae]|uniref:hypothetical protein n=1 Tax=Klebsiella pneumoniae TaxID=573 RepID=UPI0008482159|nr:hypothetical protein [Klebsiella pneumoniae]MCS6630620.1 hypothetical protein [Klebsiella pneumoniae subsp. pneumoniae]MEA4437510.1 hypothetical protein [Klebsiella pneumoniae]ODP88773.1 hypothetical protein A9X63_18605 [Klebsiella pneumoniae]
MDMKENRRIRLKEWFASRAIPEREKSYLSQLMGGKTSFGERAARRLERDYGMTPGFLDTPVESEQEPVSAPLTEQQSRLLSLFDRLPESEKEPHIAALAAMVENYDKLFEEMLKSRDINELIKKSRQ